MIADIFFQTTLSHTGYTLTSIFDVRTVRTHAWSNRIAWRAMLARHSLATSIFFTRWLTLHASPRSISIIMRD
jgi:hypothetical protein